jgi:hypothetical protein
MLAGRLAAAPVQLPRARRAARRTSREGAPNREDCLDTLYGGSVFEEEQQERRVRTEAVFVSRFSPSNDSQVQLGRYQVQYQADVLPHAAPNPREDPEQPDSADRDHAVNRRRVYCCTTWIPGVLGISITRSAW